MTSAPNFKANVIFYGFLTLLSAHFSIAYVTSTRFFVDLADYQNGLARLPYQYRALTAWLLHGVVQSQTFVDVAHRLPNPFQQPEVLGLAIINFLAVIAVTELVRRSISVFVDDPMLTKVLCFLMPLSMYFSYVALANTYKLSFPYDIPNLPIFAGCVCAIFQRHSKLMQVMFCLACLSRETSAFLIFIYLLYEADRMRDRPAKILANALMMCVILFLTKLLIGSLYAGNPLETGSQVGGLFTLRLQNNLGLITTPQYWPNILSSGGFLWIILLITYRFIPDAALRRTLWVAVPWMVAMSVVALLTEVRIFGELTVLLSILAAVGIFNFLKSNGYRAPVPDREAA